MGRKTLRMRHSDGSAALNSCLRRTRPKLLEGFPVKEAILMCQERPHSITANPAGLADPYPLTYPFSPLGG